MSKILGWGIRKLGMQTILSWLLLSVALSSAALGLNSTVHGLDIILVLTVTQLGLLAGWLIGKSTLRSWQAGIGAVALGIVIVFLRVGQLVAKVIALVQALVSFVKQILNWRALRSLPDATPILQISRGLATDSIALATRVRDWLVTLASGSPTFDPVAAALMWSFILWLLASWAAWSARRRAQPLEAFLPSIALVGAILAYTGASPSFLVPIAGAMLLLMVLISAGVREGRWNLAKIDFAEDIRIDLALNGIVLSLLLIGVAVVMPSVSITQIAHSVERWFAPSAGAPNPLPDSIGLVVQPRPTTIFDTLRTPGLPRQHLIGAGPELSKQLAMRIKIDDINAAMPTRYYWRANTYEKYTGRGWATEATQIVDYQAGEQTTTQSMPAQHLVRQQVQIIGNLGKMIYATGSLVSADHSFQVEWRSQADNDLFGASIEPNAYQVESFVPVVSEPELRVAGNNYPDWIRTRYLNLPTGVPERVLVLARDLTATAPTLFDRAQAIETYLRQFPYTLDLPAPPLNRDVVDYFLFDLKRGYCDYYASTMVVLARAAGLPARLVVGYATGTYDPATAQYVITEADAHSWVEVYFPHSGWVEFEPTGGREPIDRSGIVNLTDVHHAGETPGTLPASRFTSNTNLWLLLPTGIALVVLGILGWVLFDGYRLRWLAPESAIENIFNRLCQWGSRLGLAPRSADTPDEIASHLIQHLARIRMGKRGDASQKAEQDIRWLTRLYILRRYSAHPLNTDIKHQAIRIWQQLDARLWRAWLSQLWQRLTRRKSM